MIVDEPTFCDGLAAMATADETFGDTTSGAPDRATDDGGIEMVVASLLVSCDDDRLTRSCAILAIENESSSSSSSSDLVVLAISAEIDSTAFSVS